MPPQQQSASHRIRRIHRTFCWGWSPTDFTDLHRWLGAEDSSGGILASVSAKCLPQNTQNSQNLLQGMVSHRFHRSAQMVRVRRFSHRIHRFHRTVCWGCSPTDFTDLHRWLGCEDSSGGILASAAAKCLPQNTQNSQNLLQGMVSHRFHRFTQMVRGRRFSHRIHRSANFRGCTCLKCTNKANSGPPTDFTDLHRSC